MVFVNRFPKNESQELNLKIVHADLLTYPFKRFSLEKFLESHRPLIRNQPLATLVEFPLADFLPLVNKLRQVGAFIIYDTIDAWDASLGANWYTEQVELEVCAQSDALTATAPQLASRLAQLTGRQVTLAQCCQPEAIRPQA